MFENNGVGVGRFFRSWKNILVCFVFIFSTNNFDLALKSSFVRFLRLFTFALWLYFCLFTIMCILRALHAVVACRRFDMVVSQSPTEKFAPRLPCRESWQAINKRLVFPKLNNELQNSPMLDDTVNSTAFLAIAKPSPNSPTTKTCIFAIV